MSNAILCPLCGGPVARSLGQMRGAKVRWMTLRRWNDAEMQYEEYRTWEPLDAPATISEPPFLYVDKVWVG